MRTRAHILFPVALACALGCSKTTAAPPTGAPADRPHVPGTPHTDDVVKAWQGAGLAADGFVSVDPTAYRAGYCSQGQVAGVETVICEYSDDASLNQAKQQIQDSWKRQALMTGVAVQQKRTLIAVADRAKADPTTKTISKLISTFKQL
jgi:hypothetical protein